MTGSLIATWQGPFNEPEFHNPEKATMSHTKIATSTPSMIVLTTTASQMAASDPAWWTFH
jgi:hypothetical protein